MTHRLMVFFGLSLLFNVSVSSGSDFDTKIPIWEKGAVTYYVSGHIDGYGETDFMVDTGSSYTAISEKMLVKLRSQGKVEYIKQVPAVLANGSRVTLPVYRISSINIGGRCSISDIKAVILPGSTRNILGLSALKKIAPFALSVSPPTLMLSNCPSSAVL